MNPWLARGFHGENADQRQQPDREATIQPVVFAYFQ